MQLMSEPEEMMRGRGCLWLTLVDDLQPLAIRLVLLVIMIVIIIIITAFEI